MSHDYRLPAQLICLALLAGCSNSATDQQTVVQPPLADAAKDDGQQQPAVGSVDGTGQQLDHGPQDPLADWPRPRVAIVVSGRQYGYLEPCGCTGLDYQKGGLARKNEFLRQLREERKWQLLPVDVGNQVRRFGRQPELKFQLTIDGFRKAGYRAIGLGPDDLRLPAGELVASIAEETPGGGGFVSANVTVIDRDLMPRFRVVEVDGQRIGITSVLATSRQARVLADDVIMQPASEVLPQVVEQMQAANCQTLILLVQGSLDETRKLAGSFPAFSFLLTAGGAGDPPKLAEQLPADGPRIIQVGPKGMFMGVIGLYDDATTPWRYARIDLDSRYPDSAQVLEQLRLYQQELERAGLEGLGLRPGPHPSGATFVGSEACASCHAEQHEIWSATGHARATESLVQPVERAAIPRHFDPECISCHVTGWHPSKYYPYEGGYLSLTESPHLLGNGCENCHGPGSRHVAAEAGAGETELLAFRKAMKLDLAKAENTCLTCHDIDNSPDFHDKGAFLEYWEQIKH